MNSLEKPEQEIPVEEIVGRANEAEDSHADLTCELYEIENALNDEKVPDAENAIAENIVYARSCIEKLHSDLQLLDEALAKLQKPALTIVGKD